MSRHVFSLFLARIPVFFTICVTWDVIVDKVAEKPLEDQRVTFHFLCHPTRQTAGRLKEGGGVAFSTLLFLEEGESV